MRFPEPSTSDWIDLPEFADALRLHIARHRESYWMLHRSIIEDGENFDRKTIQNWAAGAKLPRSAVGIRMLERIERRYRLPAGYFAAKLPRTGRALAHALPNIDGSERRRLAWHLPDDFDVRPPAEREDILHWIGRR